MTEFANVRQPEKGKRRMFTGRLFRLYVWYSEPVYSKKVKKSFLKKITRTVLKEKGKITGFELIYGPENGKGIVRYDEKTKYLTHNHLIDDERSEVLSMSDMYGEDKGKLSKHVFELFEAEWLPPSIKNYVINNLQRLL